MSRVAATTEMPSLGRSNVVSYSYITAASYNSANIIHYLIQANKRVVSLPANTFSYHQGNISQNIQYTPGLPPSQLLSPRDHEAAGARSLHSSQPMRAMSEKIFAGIWPLTTSRAHSLKLSHMLPKQGKLFC